MTAFPEKPPRSVQVVVADFRIESIEKLHELYEDTIQALEDLDADCTRYLEALREIQAIPYTEYADSEAGKRIADIVSAALKRKGPGF